MEQPSLQLPYPFTRAAFEAALPQVCKNVEWMYNVVFTLGGTVSAEHSPAHALVFYSVRAGQPDPGAKGTEIANRVSLTIPHATKSSAGIASTRRQCITG
jgi:hypothetical protein